MKVKLSTRHVSFAYYMPDSFLSNFLSIHAFNKSKTFFREGLKIFLPCTLPHIINGECTPPSQSSKPGKNMPGILEQGLPPQGGKGGPQYHDKEQFPGDELCREPISQSTFGGDLFKNMKVLMSLRAFI